MKLYKKIILGMIFGLFFTVHVTYTNSKYIAESLTLELRLGLIGGLARAMAYGKSHESICPTLPVVNWVSKHNIREGIFTMMKYVAVLMTATDEDVTDTDEDEEIKKFSFFIQNRCDVARHYILCRLNPCGTAVQPCPTQYRFLDMVCAVIREGFIGLVNDIAFDQAEFAAKKLIESKEKEDNQLMNPRLKALLLSASGSFGSFAWSYIIGQLRSIKKPQGETSSKLVWCLPPSLIPEMLSFGFRLEMNGFNVPTVKILFYG
jgi:hypothetical protein